MAQMTEKRYKAMKEEMVLVKERLADALEKQAAASDLGDLSENAEYETAKRDAKLLSQRKAELEEEIASAELVDEDTSPRITIGSVIDVVKLDSNGKPIGSPRRFTLENKGDTVIQKILGASSSLGKAVLNGVSGVYKIPDNGGLIYKVTKVIEV